jgi:general secretion pathway protein G
MKRPSSRSRARGFTLLEIMLVVGIIAVLMGAAIYKLSGSLDIAKEKRVEADLSALTTQLRTYEMQNMFLPTTEQGLSALVAPPTTDPRPRRWKQLMTELPIDPWGTPYQYRYPGKRNPQSFDLYSLGADKVESDDDIGNWAY